MSRITLILILIGSIIYYNEPSTAEVIAATKSGSELITNAVFVLNPSNQYKDSILKAFCILVFEKRNWNPVSRWYKPTYANVTTSFIQCRHQWRWKVQWIIGCPIYAAIATINKCRCSSGVYHHECARDDVIVIKVFFFKNEMSDNYFGTFVQYCLLPHKFGLLFHNDSLPIINAQLSDPNEQQSDGNKQGRD
jgi:hypothetical protein